LLAEIAVREPERALAVLREVDRLYREQGMVDGAEQNG